MGARFSLLALVENNRPTPLQLVIFTWNTGTFENRLPIKYELSFF